ILVVKTTSATAGSGAASGPPAIRPRKRVPSSRRRNPGSAKRVSAANLILRGGSWRFGIRRCGRSRRRRWLEWNRGSRRRCRRNVLRLRSKSLLQNRAWCRRMGRHQLENEGETEEDSAPPPADLGEKISSLTNPDQSVRRRAGAAEARGESRALSALKQNGKHQDDAIYDQQSE